MPPADNDRRLTNREIGRIVTSWLGVEGGYLADFSYSSHNTFWLEACDLIVDTHGFDGTTRECFIHTLSNASASDQSKALRAILDGYSAIETPDPDHPHLRTPRLERIIRSWISRLETGQDAVTVTLASASEIVRRVLDDADNLIRTSGPQSAVDRVHTAMHGYLHGLASDAGITVESDRPTMNQLLRALRAQHPALVDLGARPDDIGRILNGMATIFDALNPVRNNASAAHPNDEIVGEPEAILIINTVRTVLSYLEAKRRQIISPTSTAR